MKNPNQWTLPLRSLCAGTIISIICHFTRFASWFTRDFLTSISFPVASHAALVVSMARPPKRPGVLTRLQLLFTHLRDQERYCSLINWLSPYLALSARWKVSSQGSIIIMLLFFWITTMISHSLCFRNHFLVRKLCNPSPHLKALPNNMVSAFIITTLKMAISLTTCSRSTRKQKVLARFPLLEDSPPHSIPLVLPLPGSPPVLPAPGGEDT